MLKIGDLANFCGISIRALRHYSRIGLLKPEHTDSATGYRYYSEEQIQQLVFILDLKDIGFSLNEIAAILKKNAAPTNLIDRLHEKKAEAEDNIRLEEQRIEMINALIQNIQREVTPKESDMQSQTLKSNKQPQFDTKTARLVTLDSCNSEARHAIEEAVWL